MSNPFEKVMSRLRGAAPRDPSRDWLILLSLAFIILMSLIAWNVWAFDTIASGGVIGPKATSTPAAFNRSSIDTIRTIFEKRAAEEAKYVTGAYRFADPSQ
jgi:hypothetical protein